MNYFYFFLSLFFRKISCIHCFQLKPSNGLKTWNFPIKKCRTFPLFSNSKDDLIPFLKESLQLDHSLVYTQRKKNASRKHAISESDDEKDESTTSRRLFMASFLMSTGMLIGSSNPPVALATELLWTESPVNKRFGKTLYDSEEFYNIRFITYLSRFLLNFDDDCQRWWYTRGADIPKLSTKEQVTAVRFKQFGSFSASIEIGLQEYGGQDGPRRLMETLLTRYCPDLESLKRNREKLDKAPFNPGEEKKMKREIKEARRQIAFLFGLLRQSQPVDDMTRLLAAIDNASVQEVIMTDIVSGYPMGTGYENPIATFPPSEGGDEYETATGTGLLKANGKILYLDVQNGGVGYSSPPIVSISPPSSALKSNNTKTATAQAYIFRDGQNKGKVERIQVVDGGSGYAENERISVNITLPELSFREGGERAEVNVILEGSVVSIKVINNGSGYAAEKPMKVYVDPPPLTMRSTGKNNEAKPILVATSYARAEIDSYKSFRIDDDFVYAEKVNGKSSGDSTLNSLSAQPYWGNGPSSSSELLYLLPSGIGLEFNSALKRYELAVSGLGIDEISDNLSRPIRKPIDPEFGPRGRSPIERQKDLDTNTILRFFASGALCSSSAHLALTPIDVVKTRIQTDPENYTGIISGFKNVLSNEGMSAFFTGWEPTFVGFFFNGGLSYTGTEFFRRYYTNLVGIEASNYEIPIILAAAGTTAILCAFQLPPFEAVRVRTVAQPDYASNAFFVLKRMIAEEGFLSLFSAVPAFLFKEIPYNCAKFLVYDLSVSSLYDLFPAAREDLQLSLLVSIVGGCLGGTAAAFVSNPADATISTMKKNKSDLNAFGTARLMLDTEGYSAFGRGLGLRMFFYSIITSLQFLIFDGIRFSLGIGSDDLKLYLDVLGGALRENGGPI